MQLVIKVLIKHTVYDLCHLVLWFVLLGGGEHPIGLHAGLSGNQEFKSMPGKKYLKIMLHLHDLAD